MNRLEGKVAVITGGASGIGEATVRLFAAEGAQVVIADVQDHRGRKLADSLANSLAESAGRERAIYRHADVSREGDVMAVIELALERFGRLDLLFNNAGFGGPGGGIEEIEAEGWDATMAVLLRGVFLGMKHAAPVMKRQGGGSIISTASVAGMSAGYGPHVYSAAKAAVIQLTRTVAVELGESGVRVNCICPGGIATPIFGKAFGLAPEEADATVPVMRQALAGRQPIQRAGLPEDVAQAALWLASEESAYVNGQALVVDGGLTSGRLWSQAQKQRALLRSALKIDG